VFPIIPKNQKKKTFENRLFGVWQKFSLLFFFLSLLSLFPQVKKLDNIINALQTPAVKAASSGPNPSDSNRRLESVRKTREVLITDPNSKAHLRIGKLKAVRKRAAGLLARGGGGGTSSGSDSGGSAGGVSIGGAIGGFGGFQSVADKGGGMSMLHQQQQQQQHQQHFHPAQSAFFAGGGLSGGGGGSGGMDGLLEAAASLSDGETPGTPTRDQHDELRDRSPRISGWEGGAGAGFGAGAGAGHGMVGGGGVWDAAAVLGALKPGGAFTAVVAPRPTRPVPHNAATGAPAEHFLPAPGAIDPNVYAAAMAAFVRPPAAAAGAAAPGAMPSGMPGMHPQMAAAMPGMNLNPHMAQMFAWMAAMGGAAQAHQAQHHQLQHQHQQPHQPHQPHQPQQQQLPVAWNPAAFQQMVAAAPAPPQQLQVAHQPL
jgi:hypothetical protein